MKSLPQGWPRISASVFYDDAPAAIAWLARAFGFEARLTVDGPDGRVMHSELTFGDGLVMVASADGAGKSPQGLSGANTQGLYVLVDDVDEHCESARAAGATILSEPETQEYGHRTYGVEDLEGHRWFFGQMVADA